MKREVIFILILFSFIFVPLVLADEAAQVDKAYTCVKDKINSSGCSSLSFDEKVFSLLSVGECKQEIIAQNSSGNCWPSPSCTIKSTAQTILALENSNSNYNITSAENWLLSQKEIPSSLKWFLEIDSNEKTSCTLYYPGQEQGAEIIIGEDKKISSSALGNCISLAKNDYLLEVSSPCYNEEIRIQCDKGFITTLLFQKDDSSTLNVLDKVQSGSAGSTNIEKIESWCFAKSGVCDYEGSLWASEVLFYLGKDTEVSPFLPYLIAFSEDNQKYLPESFLYYLTGEFRNELLIKQKASQYWYQSDDRYYDTALALLPLLYESPKEKQNSIGWLLNSQSASGCWNDENLLDTAFILYSVWPDYYDGSSVCGDGFAEGNEKCDGTDLNGESCTSLEYESGSLECYSEGNSRECQFDVSNCEIPTECDEDNPCPNNYDCNNGKCVYNQSSSNYECDEGNPCFSGKECVSNVCVESEITCLENDGFCMSAITCSESDGEIILGTCSGVFKCCDTPKLIPSCLAQNGKICLSDETCKSGLEVEASGLSQGQKCCLNGKCEVKTSGGTTTTDTCTTNGGTCKSSCFSDETNSFSYTCSSSTDSCCVPQTPPKSKWFIWVIIILIFLVVLGIVFREKLKILLIKLKTNRKPKNSFGDRPNFGGVRPMHNSQPQRPIPRRIIHPSQRPSPPRTPEKKPTKTSKELDDVLKKLKDLGNK